MFKRQRSICMIFGLVITALLATSGTVGARQGEADTEIWYWAYNDSQIIAYTLDGQSRVIYEAEGAFVDRRLEGLRLSPERAWLLDNYNQNFPPLLDSHGALSPLGAGVYPQVYEHPYLVVAQIGFNPREGFVYNMETQEIRQLTDRLVRNYYADGQHQTPRFLADGHTLRYYSVNEASLEASNKGTLWELDLLTGNETALLGIPFITNGFYASEDGEQWWFPKELLDYSYGTVVTYGPTNAQITEFFKARDGRFHLNHLVVYGTNEITLYPLSDDVPVVYEIPSRELFYFHLYPDGRLLVADDSLQWWLLHPQAAPQSLGILPPFTIDEVEFRLGGDGAFSSDGRWVITKRDWHTDLYQLRDIERGIVVLETTVEELLIVQYTADKILLRERSYLTEESGEKGILYLAEEQRTIFLPDAPTGRWWELLPDGRLLYEEEPTSEIRTPGIYVYDVATEEFAPLLLNVKQIWLRRDFNR